MVVKEVKIQLNVLISIFLMIYMSRDTVLFGTTSDEAMKLLGYVVYGVLTLYWVLKGRIYKSYFIMSLVFIFLGLVTLVTTGVNIKIFYVFLLIVLAAFFCSNVKFENFVETYNKVMLFFAIYSIVAFVLYEIAYSVVVRFPSIKNEAGVTFINLLFDMPMVKTPYVAHRSFGVFREPGVYMIFLTIALVFELFFSENNRNKRMAIHAIVYIVALVLTFSTAGYIIMALVLVLYLLFGSSNPKHRKLKAFVFVAFLIGSLWLFFDKSFFDIVFGKLVRDSYSKESRLESVYTNIRMIMSNIEYFMTGLGFSFVEDNFRYYSNDTSVGDNTNTIFRIFATYGFLYTTLLMGLIFKFFARLKNTFLAILLFCIFCLCLFNESLIVNFILYIMAFYSLDPNFDVGKV